MTTDASMNISSISFDKQSVLTSSGQKDDYMQRIDDRVNQKIAKGMKKAIHLIVGKFDDMYQEKMKLFVREEIEGKIIEVRREMAELRELIQKKDIVKNSQMSQRTYGSSKQTKESSQKASQAASRFINSPPEILGHQDANSRYESSQLSALEKAKSLMDIKSDNGQQYMADGIQEIEGDRDKKLSKILKKVNNETQAACDNKSQNDGQLSQIEKRQSLNDLAKSQISNLNKSFKSQFTNKSNNKSTMTVPTQQQSQSIPLQKTRSTNHPSHAAPTDRKRSTGRHQSGIKKQDRKKKSKGRMVSAIAIEKVEDEIDKKQFPTENEKQTNNQLCQINKYLELTHKNSVETPLLNIEVDQAASESMVILDDSIPVDQSFNLSYLNTTQTAITAAKLTKDVPKKEKKKSEKRQNEDKKKISIPNINENQGKPAPPAAESHSKQQTKKYSDKKSKSKTKVEKRKESLKRKEEPKKKQNNVPVIEKYEDFSPKSKMTENGPSNRNTLQRPSDMPMNIITQPLPQATNGQEYIDPVIIPSTSIPDSMPVTNSLDIVQQSNQPSMAHQMRPSLQQQFIVATPHLSMFINRKSIDQMASPEELENDQIDNQSPISEQEIQKSAERQVSSSRMQLQQFRDLSQKVVIQSQEIVQSVQKEPLYLLTLKRENDQDEDEASTNKQIIYLTTSRDFVSNNDSVTLLENIYNYYMTYNKSSTLQASDIFDMFIFKILSGTNANSPGSILQKLQSMGQNIVYLNNGQQPNVSVRPRMFAIEGLNTKKDSFKEEIQQIDEENEEIIENNSKQDLDNCKQEQTVIQQIDEQIEEQQIKEDCKNDEDKEEKTYQFEDQETSKLDEQIKVEAEEAKIEEIPEFEFEPEICQTNEDDIVKLPEQSVIDEAPLPNFTQELEQKQTTNRLSNLIPRPINPFVQKSSSARLDLAKVNSQKNTNTHRTSIQSSVNMNLSNESSMEQQEPDNIPTPRLPPQIEACEQTVNDLFLQKFDSNESNLPAQIHHDPNDASPILTSNNQTLQPQYNNFVPETPSSLESSIMSSKMQHNPQFTNSTKVEKGISDSKNDFGSNFIDQIQIAHKRSSTEQVDLNNFVGPNLNHDFYGRSEIISDSEIRGVCEQVCEQSSKLINKSDTRNRQLSTRYKPSTISPTTMHSSLQQKSNAPGSKTKRGESKSKHQRNSSLSKKSQVVGFASQVLPPRHVPVQASQSSVFPAAQPSCSQISQQDFSKTIAAPSRGISTNALRSGARNRMQQQSSSALRPSQAGTTLKSAAFIPEMSQKLAKVQDTVNRVGSIVRSRSAKRMDVGNIIGGQEGRDKELLSKLQAQSNRNASKSGMAQGTASKRQGSNSLSKTRITSQQPVNSSRTGSVSKRGTSKQKDKGYGMEKKFNNLLLGSEQEKFGDRCPTGFKKVGLLGKGGAAIVWLAEVINSRKYPGHNMVALKQFPKTRGKIIDTSAKTEIEIGNILFPFNLREGCDGSKSTDFKRGMALSQDKHAGMKHIAKFLDQIEDYRDVWLVYEVGPSCLRKALCDVKGEFFKGERIYRVQHLQFYNRLLTNKSALKSFVIKVAEALDLLQQFGIVHSDLKPDNILVEINQHATEVQGIKLIDFGTSFQFYKATQVASTTPEYLAPEILKTLDDRNNPQKVSQQLTSKCKPWSFDVWSLGVILLEIATGCPIWMSLKCRVLTVDGKNQLCHGLFGVQQREVKKIMAKQNQVLRNLHATLKKFECYGLDDDPQFMNLLARMLCEDPTQRIAPSEILEHKFCKS